MEKTTAKKSTGTVKTAVKKSTGTVKTVAQKSTGTVKTAQKSTGTVKTSVKKSAGTVKAAVKKSAGTAKAAPQKSMGTVKAAAPKSTGMAAPKNTGTVKKTPAQKTAPAPQTPKVMNLFDAYAGDQLPKDHGYIVSSFINANTGYSIYEVISYSGVKAIYPDGSGLTFQSQGKKLHTLIEPASYSHKGIEPYLREKVDQIPLRFKELKKIITKNQSTIYFAQKPIESLSSFTVARPLGLNISFVFYNRPDLYVTLAKFFEHSFSQDAGLPINDAKTGSLEIAAIVKKTMNFKGEYNG